MIIWIVLRIFLVPIILLVGTISYNYFKSKNHGKNNFGYKTRQKRNIYKND